MAQHDWRNDTFHWCDGQGNALSSIEPTVGGRVGCLVIVNNFRFEMVGLRDFAFVSEKY